MSRSLARFILGSALATLVGCSGEADAHPTGQVKIQNVDAFESTVVSKDVPYVPTPQATVNEMLRMANVSSDDLVYDLGSGDGRIVVTAAKEHGARGIGIDIDPQRISEANENAKAAGVTDKVEFIRGDLFQTDLRPATAVTLYLLPSVNLRLRPKLLEELRPGTPVVSHDFDMGDWEPDVKKRVEHDDLFLWIIPAKVEGRWTSNAAGSAARAIEFDQKYQKVSGNVEGGNLIVRNGRLAGDRITFELAEGDGEMAAVVERYDGRVGGRSIRGTVELSDGRRTEWTARR